MFSRMVHFTPRSFQPKNILGAVASGTLGVMSLGLTSALAPKLFSAHSKTMQTVGKIGAIVGGTIAGGVGISAVAPGLLPTIGSGAMNIFGGAGGLLKTIGGGVLGMFGGGGGGGQQPPQQVQDMGPQQQFVVPQPQPQPYFDPMYNQSVMQSAGAPLGGGTLYPSMPDPSPANYGQPLPDDTQLPTAMTLTDPSQAGMMIDPSTGQLVPIQQAGMIPNLSTTTWLMIGGATVIGWYLLSDSKKEIAHA